MLAAAAGWFVGLVWFLRLASLPASPPLHADGIVALTGGAARVETALHLLAEGRADRLLLSGVGGGAELRALARRAGVDPALLAPRVTMGRSATSTHGNAQETEAWVRQNGIRSLIVVTAGYHMPRALIEIGRAVPHVALHPVPVQPPAMRDSGIEDPEMLRLMAGEYTKWLVAALGLSRYHSFEPAG
ncbi:MAG: YdcF family protein [Acetobacteraceae bacterium]|nr:YdcF family protein [Acetobacteraceae bacterium]